jgi:hypothetical protein
VNDTGKNRLRNAETDYFRAYRENGGLAMEPYCRCGEQLNEDYHCATCDRDCRCTTFVCDDEATLAAVKQFIEEQPSFKGFRTLLAAELD